jgi:hypothetical protein
VYIDKPLLADFQTLSGYFYVIDGGFCCFIQQFLISEIMRTIAEIILSRNNDLYRFLIPLCIHHLKPSYMDQNFFLHSFLLSFMYRSV